MAPLKSNLSRRVSPQSVLLAGLVVVSSAQAQFTDFMTMDLEDLSYVRMTTLGRTEHAIFDYPAAATVLSADEISASGATSLAETFRGVPGMQVARVDSFNYAISIRGFNDNTANKLLVVADGRSLRDSTFSGTNWGMQTMILNDLERIEVLRGPGASLWGANSMNGFINVVSKASRDTIGSHARVEVGDNHNSSVEARYGWKVNDTTSARIYAKTQEDHSFGFTAPPDIADWRTTLVGARTDHRLKNEADLSIIAEWRHLDLDGESFAPSVLPPYGKVMPDPRTADTINASVKLEQPVSLWDGHITAFVGAESAHDNRESFEERRQRYTLDLQAKFTPWLGHHLLSGFTYERTDDELSSSAIFSFAQPEASVTFVGAFLQDEFELIPERLRVTIGGKIERNTYSGWEPQPSVRMIWAPHRKHRVWAAWSVAARTPTRAETSVNYYASVLPPSAELPFPTAITILGSPEMDSEKVTAMELGYRFQPQPQLTFELSGFYNDYEDLRGFIADSYEVRYTPLPHVIAYLATNNGVQGHTRGGELSVRWEAFKGFLLEASHSRISHDLVDAISPEEEISRFAIGVYTDTTPEHLTQLSASWSPHSDWRVKVALHHNTPMPDKTIPAYTGLNLHLAWKFRPNWEASLIGRDLLEDRHREFPETFSRQVTPNIGRSVFLRLTFER